MHNKNSSIHTKYMKNKVGEYRYKHNMSIAELAERSGMSTTAISNLENEYTSDILLSNAVSLSHVLQVDLYELFCIKRQEELLIRTYFNLICEEVEATGGKVIHIDKNAGDMEEVHKIVCEHIEKYPNAKWELYPMIINN